MHITGTNLRSRRQELGLSQAKLAELCGISQHLLSAFELEKTDLPGNLLDMVASALSDKQRVSKLSSFISFLCRE